MDQINKEARKQDPRPLQRTSSVAVLPPAPCASLIADGGSALNALNIGVPKALMGEGSTKLFEEAWLLTIPAPDPEPGPVP